MALLWMVLAGLVVPVLPLAAQSPSTPRVVECGTESRERVLCAAGGRVESARLVQDLSAGRCGPAGSWGWTGNALWADNACRGRFEVRYPGAADTVASRRITCGTLSSRRAECSTQGPVDTVRLVRRSTFARCTEGTNWGHRDTLIWAGQGCRAEFEVVYRRAAAPSPVKPATRTLACGKRGGSETCRTDGYADTVRLVRDSTGSLCRQRVTWGFTYAFVWTRDGCRGLFEVAYRDTASAAPEDETRRITCGNYSGAQVTCKLDVNATGVRLVKDYTGTRCEEGSTWGHNEKFIWTRRGCRAEFEVTYRSATRTSPRARRLTCGSASAIQVQCDVGGDALEVRVVRDVGSSECRRGSNWQYADRKITAGRGCRAEFEVTLRSVGPDTTSGMQPVAPTTRVITCGNASGAAMSCNAFGTVATVRLQRDRSAGRCSQPSSWGLDDKTVWVARSCYGDFEVTYNGVR